MSPERSEPADHLPSGIDFVLVETSHPGNIGAAARALGTMGLRSLSLVAPHAFPHREASAMAAHAQPLLERARVLPDLPAALAGCQLVLGATARRRGVVLELLDPAAAAARVLAANAAGQRVALLFGNERTGLSNEQVQFCHAGISIPSAADCPSLNLAQAVQLIAWELRRAWIGLSATAPAGMRPGGDAPALPADAALLEGFFGHLERTLEAIDFHKGRSARTILQRLRRLFLRAQPDAREIRILRGILADVERTARLLEAGQARSR